MATFTHRMIGAAKLDVNIYEEVEADERALGQAMLVVVISSLAAGIATLRDTGASDLIILNDSNFFFFGGMGTIRETEGLVILIGTLIALIGWFIWAYVTYFIGTRLLPEAQTRATPGQLLRTIGFSSSPGIIRILGLIPGLFWLVFTVAGIWMLVAMVVAVRQALDYKSTLRAVVVCLIGWVIQAIVLAIFLSLFRGISGH